jgi:phosphoribosylanthranilate isomerase
MRTRVKICGITREQDIACAVEAGVDAVGLVFYAASKRCLTRARAAQLRRLVPVFVDVVALFVNPHASEVQGVLDHVGPDLLQFHGDETARQCSHYRKPYLRAFRVGAPGMDSALGVAQACCAYPDAAGWLFDSQSAQYGGSGQGFDHALLAAVKADVRARPLILSGGLRSDNVRQAIVRLRPWAVDVSSGVEIAPGIKSDDRIAAFIAEVKKADREL